MADVTNVARLRRAEAEPEEPPRIRAAPRARKSPGAFRTISEVSHELDVPQHVLRFWETKFSQVRPMKRGGGRRYYRPEDVRLLRGIRALLYVDGYTIKGVQKLLREGGVRVLTERADQAAAAAPEMPPSSPAASEGGTSRDDQLRQILSELEEIKKLLTSRV